MFALVWIFGTIVVTIICYLIFMINPFKRPFLTESDYSYHTAPWWHIYYASKYLFHVKKTRKNENVKALFNKDMSISSDRKKLTNVKKITLAAVGDLMQRRDFLNNGARHLWDFVGKDLFSNDFCIGNLEFAINSNNIIEKLLRYSVPPHYAEPLLGDERFGKFHAVSLANNHINDSLTEGIISTCEYFDKIGVIHTGANRNAQQQDMFPIIECNGIKIALLSYTFSTNAIPLEANFDFGVNYVRFNALKDSDYDPSLIYHHIEVARQRGAELIISCHHWGVEFEYYPPLRLIQRAHDLLEAGIDCIIGHHPHIINPVERYTTKDGRETAVFYSLGSCTTYALLTPMQRLSTIAELVVEKGTDSSGNSIVRIGDITLKPVFHYIKFTIKGIEHRLIPIYEAIQSLESGSNKFKLNLFMRFIIKKLFREHQRYFYQKGINFK